LVEDTVALLTSAREIVDLVLPSALSPLISTISPDASAWNHRRFHRFRCSDRFSIHNPSANGPPAGGVRFQADPRVLMRIDPASPGRNDNANESSVISFDVEALAMAAESAIVPVHVHVMC